MKVHIANTSITHAPTVDLSDEKAVKNAERHGVVTKTVNPGEHFDPAEAGLTEEQVKAMVVRGQIREAKEGEKGAIKVPPMTISGNETDGSGATRRGQSQGFAPAGIDVGKDAADTPEPVRTGGIQTGNREAGDVVEANKTAAAAGAPAPAKVSNFAGTK